MRRFKKFPFIFGVLMMSSQVSAAPLNQVLGSWRMIEATIDKNGVKEPAYGARPNGLLTFTPDMHYIEVLTDSDIPRFASDERGQGTDAENKAAMAKNIGFFGTYTVNEKGELSGNNVQGSTFPNWVGSVRTQKDLNLVVQGDTMIENFTRPGGTKIVIHWQRVR